MGNRTIFHGKRVLEYDNFFKTNFGKKVFNLEKEILLKVLDKKDSILEVGCGTGIWLETLKREGFKKLYGVDISQDMLKLAKKKGLKNLVLGNAEDLPFKEDSFDTTVFITSLEFIDDKKKAFLEAVRVSRESVIVAFLNKLSILSLYRRVYSLFRDSYYNQIEFLTLEKVDRLRKYAREILRDKVIIKHSTYSTLNFAFNGFVNEKLEKVVGLKSPFGTFTVIKFTIKSRHGAGKRYTC
ncbi:MAG: class I SAM-dependent methyltransferase [Desulfurobacteriaceae bacterium]